MPPSTRNRVCDRCIRKKVKCDLQRPDCSRCLEAGLGCTYSVERKKPGPARGSRRHTRGTTPTNSVTTDAQPAFGGRGEALSTPGQDPLLHGLGTISLDVARGLYLPPEEVLDFGDIDFHSPAYGLTSPAVPTDSRNAYPGYSLNHEHEREILVHFFDEVHPAVPLFRTEHFLKRYDDGLVGRTLLVAIVTVTAKILGPVDFWKTEDAELCMNFLLKSASPETAIPDAHNSLDSFRLECLLAYYEFHQFPGSRSLMRVSALARRAYSIGVHQIENPELCSAFDRSTATEDDVEDWRYLFWCIYCLDSYSNIAVGTPFVVELESINTALVRNPHSQAQAHCLPTSVSKIFLPDDVEDLWKTAKDIISNDILVNYNLHLVTTTTLRQAGYIMRLRTEGKRLLTKITALKGALASLRLSLPSRYLNPTRNVLGGESCVEHHIRLTNILHLNMVYLLITICTRLDGNEAEFEKTWLESLERCQNIVSVVEQWDNQHSPRIDPAICLIIYSTLCFLELHRRSTANLTLSLIESLDQGQRLLLLVLEQFSSMWAVPRFLLHQFKTSQNRLSSTSLTYVEVDDFLNRFRIPLHPRALERYLGISTTGPDTNADANVTMYLDDIWSFESCDVGL